jgi:hypothetical protein
MIVLEKYSDTFRLVADVLLVQPEEAQTWENPGCSAEYEIYYYLEIDEIIDGKKRTFTRLAPEEICNALPEEKVLTKLRESE